MPDGLPGAGFVLPRGYSRAGGERHREGFMRPATARDEMRCLSDFRVHLRPESALPVVLARVVTRLGSLPRREIDPGLFERLGGDDLRALETLYRELNGYEASAEEEVEP
jgi:hypothetical protein